MKITCRLHKRIEGKETNESKENGTILTSIYTLDKDLKDFMRFGVAFTPMMFREIRVAIEKWSSSLLVILQTT